MSTISRVLRKHGFRYLHSRRKGIMKPTDFTKRMKFARTALKYSVDIWTKNINFYLDGTVFTHKHSPHDEARSTKTMAWKKKSEGPNPLCTTKGKRASTGDLMAHFMVALSPGRKVVWMVSSLHQWYVNSSQMCTRKLNTAKGVCFCRTGVQCKTQLLL